MRWSFALLLGFVVVPAPALAAQSQCRLVLSASPVRPTVHPHSPSSVSASVSTSTPTPTPFVPFAYGRTPIRGVNLYVLFRCQALPHALERPSDLAAQWRLVCA